MAEMTGSAHKPRNNGAIVLMCLAFVVGMGAASYAAVPLYRLFCQVTGYGGTTRRVEQASATILDRRMRVTFDANVAPGLTWDFKPVQREVDPRIGETVEIRFKATNRSNEVQHGQAIFNVTPGEAGVYFNKIQCFCFNETVLQPGETLDMPVVFYIDPDLTKSVEAKSINTITLSYTFYPKAASGPVADKGTGKTL